LTPNGRDMNGARDPVGSTATKPDPIRAAIVEPVGGHGGMNYYDAGLCLGLQRAGVMPRLYTCDATPTTAAIADLLRRPFRGIYGRDARPVRALRYLRGLVAAFADARRFGAEVVHFHFFHVGALELLAVGLARALGHVVVVTVHDVVPLKTSRSLPTLANAAYRMAHRIIVHNPSSLRELAGLAPIAHARAEVIPHGNYLGLVDPLPAQADARRRLGVPADGFTLLFFGQIKAVKGLDLVIEALAAPGPKAAGVRLLVAGKVWQDELGCYQALIDELGLGDRCTLQIRYVPDGEVPTYFAAADLVVCPYRRIYQSGVVLMAMSLGKPVLVSDIPGMTDVVRDGETGFVFRSGNVQSLAARLDEIEPDRAGVRRVAANALAYVAAAHGWDRIGRMTMAAYAAALGREPRRDDRDAAAHP
jgi:D-inositol-3-phosphate glycosyltransferase